MTQEEILKTAAEPHLIASTAKANEVLAYLNALISDLRLAVSELELKSDLYLNKLMQERDKKAIEQVKAEHKVSSVYREFKDKDGTLSDIRAIRRNLERHANMLAEQEKFKPRGYGNYPTAV